MKLLIIRHAIAMEREEFHKKNKDDSQRPLTPDGSKKMRRNVGGLKRVVPKIDILFSSPLVRAEQTARIVSEEYDDIPVEKCDELKPEEDPEGLMVFLREVAAKRLTRAKKEDGVIAVVGHEPHLSTLIGYLMSGKRTSFFELRKGGACLFEFDRAIVTGKAEMQWLLRPSVLRALAN